MGHAIWLPVPAPRRGTELDRREYSDRRPPFSTTVPHPKNHLPHPDVLPRRRDVGYRGDSREQATPRDERHVPTKTGGDHGSRPSPCSAEGRPAPTATDRSGSDATRWIPIAGWTWPSPEPPTACRPATPFRHTIRGQELLQILRMLWLVHHFIHDKLTFASGRPDWALPPAETARRSVPVVQAATARWPHQPCHGRALLRHPAEGRSRSVCLA